MASFCPQRIDRWAVVAVLVVAVTLPPQAPSADDVLPLAGEGLIPGNDLACAVESLLGWVPGVDAGSRGAPCPYAVPAVAPASEVKRGSHTDTSDGGSKNASDGIPTLPRAALIATYIEAVDLVDTLRTREMALKIRLDELNAVLEAAARQTPEHGILEAVRLPSNGASSSVVPSAKVAHAAVPIAAPVRLAVADALLARIRTAEGELGQVRSLKVVANEVQQDALNGVSDENLTQEMIAETKRLIGETSAEVSRLKKGSNTEMNP